MRNARYKQRRAADRPSLRLPRLRAASRAPTCTTSTAAARCSAPMLASIHNLHYYLNLMREMREALDAGRFEAFARSFAADRARGVD